MRVLLATDVFAPSIGGTERHVAALADALAARGHLVTVATTSPSLGGADPHGPVEIVRLRGWADRAIRRRAAAERSFHPPAPDPGTVHALELLARRSDVVHAHGWIARSAVPAAERAGRPAVLSVHDYGSTCARRTLERADGRPCAGPGADCWRCAGGAYGTVRGALLVAGIRSGLRRWPTSAEVLANSEPVAASLRAAGITCTVAPPWIAPPPGPTAADPVPGLPDEPFVAYVGALAAHKGMDVLVDAWADPPAPLVVLGTRAEADVALPSGATVHRDVAPPQVLATLARAAVAVVPSRYAEPFGLVAVEAMWAGTPVVASAAGGLVDVLDRGRAGVLVAPGDPVALRREVRSLLADPARRAALAAAGRRRAAALDGLGPVLAAYDRVLAARRAGDHPQASPPSLRT